MTVLNPAIGILNDDQKKQTEEWHQRLPKCGCGRVARYETATGLACNKYMRCDNAEFMAEQLESLRSQVIAQQAVIEQMREALGLIRSSGGCSPSFLDETLAIADNSSEALEARDRVRDAKVLAATKEES